MSVSELHSELELHSVGAVFKHGLHDDPGEAMPWAVLDQLLRLVPCQGIVFNELNVREQQPVTLQGLEEGGARDIERDFAETDQPPYAEYWTRTGDNSCRTATRSARVTSSACSAGRTSIQRLDCGTRPSTRSTCAPWGRNTVYVFNYRANPAEIGASFLCESTDPTSVSVTC